MTLYVDRSVIIPITSEVIDLAGGPLPDPHIRSLDALHLGSALLLRGAGASVAVVTLDDRMRKTATSLDFHVLP